MANSVAVSAILLTSTVLTLLLNAVLITSVIKRKRLRARATIATSILYVHLAIVEIFGALFWTTSTAYSAAVDRWALGDMACSFQVYIRIFCYMVNLFTLIILMTERVIRIYMPRKRQKINFIDNAVLLIIGIDISCACLAVFPTFPKVPITEQYNSIEYQCELSTRDGASYYIHAMVLFVGVPFGLIFVGYGLILRKLFKLKRGRAPREYMVLHHGANISGDAYFFKLRLQLEALKDIGNKKKDVKLAKRMEKNYGNDGLFDDNVIDSSDDEFEHNNTYHPQGWIFLSKNDMQLTHAYGIISALYLFTWIPFFIHSYEDTFDDDEGLGRVFILVAVCLTHFGGVCKLPFYLLSDNIHGAVWKTIWFHKKEETHTEDEDIYEHTIGTTYNGLDEYEHMPTSAKVPTA